MTQDKTTLRDPKPDPFKPVPWEALRPNDSVQRRFAGIDIGFGRVPPLGPLEELPENVEAEVNGHSDVVGDERVRVPAACNGIEALEQDDQAEEDTTGPGQIWLEGRLEDQCVTVNALREKSLVEFDVRDTDRYPGEKGRNCGQVLEPFECFAGASRAGGQVGQGGDGCCNRNAPVGDTGP